MNRSSCSIKRYCAMVRRPDRVRHFAVPVALAIVLGALCATSPAWGALYKWTDENGRVVYGDQPPPGDIKVDMINGPSPPANPNAVKEMVGKEVEIKKVQQDAAANAKKAGQLRADAEKLSGMCRDARSEFTRLSADQILLYSVNEKGEAVFMNDTDRRRRRETLETYLKANCPPG